MIYTDMTRRAIKLACRAHAGQEDKSGIPYICHPLHIAEEMEDEIHTVTALLHDVAEDTAVTLEDLEKEGFPQEVLSALELLVHRQEMPYLDYIKSLKDNPVARTVKLADLAHNMDTSRLEQITEADEKRLQVYGQAYEILKEK
jgi:(p)ppGpp synthase/HD superfamily hydrolase